MFGSEVFGALIVVLGLSGSGSALHELSEVRFGKFGGIVGELFHRSSPYPCARALLLLKTNFRFSASPRR